MSAVGLFSLAADMVKLKCDCGKSEMIITHSADGKVRLQVPCLICSNPHTFTLNTSLFFSREIFIFPCPYAEVDIAFIGHENHVKAELARSELELIELLEENGIESFEALHSEEDEESFTDPQVHDIIMFVLRDLEETGDIHCKCEDHGNAEYEFEVADDHIRVFCKSCGAEKKIATDSILTANAFLNCESITLE